MIKDPLQLNVHIDAAQARRPLKETDRTDKYAAAASFGLTAKSGMKCSEYRMFALSLLLHRLP